MFNYTLEMRKSPYDNFLPTVRVTGTGYSTRQMNAQLHRLAAAAEDITHAQLGPRPGWIVQVDIHNERVQLELETGMEREAIRGLEVLRAAVEAVQR